MKLLYKIVVSVLLCGLFFAGFNPSLIFGEEVQQYEDVIYDHILDDYLLITHLEKSEADALYNEIKENGFDETLVKKIETILYSKIVNTEYEDNVFFIQDNYNQVIRKVSPEDKEIIDKYLLNYAIQYYAENGSAEDFFEVPERYSFSEVNEGICIDNEDFEKIFVDSNEIILDEKDCGVSTRAKDKVAAVRVFADPTQSTVGSSGLEIDLGTHAWITVSNISDKNITVGKFSIRPGKTMALGTWGNKSEHTGLWYNLESYAIKHESAYDNRVSLRVDLSPSSLKSLNTHIVGYDRWSKANNCSSFAVSSWNKVCSTKLSAGLINTPKNLANSIKSVDGYYEGFPVRHYYKVYYAQGFNSPVLSDVWN